MIERRYAPTPGGPVQLQTRGAGLLPAIVGYAAVFFDESDPAGTQYSLWEDVVERILPSAFTQALQNPDDARALWNHSPDTVLGRVGAGTLKLSVDKKGLYYSIDPPNTTAANDLVESIGRGDVVGSSFGFIVQDQNWREVGQTLIREIQSVQLFDISPVCFPAYSGTSVGLRGDDRAAVEEQYQDWKRQGRPAGQARPSGWSHDAVMARLRCVELGI